MAFRFCFRNDKLIKKKYENEGLCDVSSNYAID